MPNVAYWGAYRVPTASAFVGKPTCLPRTNLHDQFGQWPICKLCFKIEFCSSGFDLFCHLSLRCLQVLSLGGSFPWHTLLLGAERHPLVSQQRSASSVTYALHSSQAMTAGPGYRAVSKEGHRSDGGTETRGRQMQGKTWDRCLFLR